MSGKYFRLTLDTGFYIIGGMPPVRSPASGPLPAEAASMIQRSLPHHGTQPEQLHEGETTWKGRADNRLATVLSRERM